MIETKANTGHDREIKNAMYEFLNAFEEFKKSNDERLGLLEKKNKTDVLLDSRVDRINQALTDQKMRIDDMLLKKERPYLGETAGQEPDEKKAAFERYIRTGDVVPGIIRERKGLNAGTDSEGGYLAPEKTEEAVLRSVRNISPLRQIASVQEIGSSVFRKPVSSGSTGAGWTGETDSRSDTSDLALRAIDFPAMEMYAMPAASQTLLDDSMVDIEQWISDEVQDDFAVQESRAFIEGNGNTQPKGILKHTLAGENSRTDSQIGYITTGVNAGFPAVNPADVILDLVYTPLQSYRANGRFLLNRSTLSVLRKFKDADGNYLWQPSAQAGQPARLAGYPVSECEEMPSIGNNRYAIAFGDFRKAYLIVDRTGIRILRDPYSAKPYVLFYTTKRVGGGIQDFNAVKLLRFSA